MNHLLSKNSSKYKKDVSGYTISLFESTCSSRCQKVCALSNNNSGPDCVGACSLGCGNSCNRGCSQNCGQGAKWD